MTKSKMPNKIISFLLSFVMLFSITAGLDFSVFAEDAMEDTTLLLDKCIQEMEEKRFYEVDLNYLNYEHNGIYHFSKSMSNYYMDLINDDSIVVEAEIRIAVTDATINYYACDIIFKIFNNNVLYRMVKPLNSVVAIPVINVPSTVQDNQTADYVINLIKETYSPKENYPPEYLFVETMKNELSLGFVNFYCSEGDRNTIEYPNGYTFFSEDGVGEVNNYIVIKKQSHSHGWNKGIVLSKPTCKSFGEKIYTCTECGETKAETLPKTEHTYKTTTTKATTKKNGSVVTKCSVCGTVKSTSTIYYPKTITLSKTSYTYDGKAKKPSVTVKDSKGKKISASNYTVSYSKGRKNVGKYTVTIKFKGNYSGTVKKTFTIKPKSTTISKVTAGKKAFTVKWKKQTTQTTGYQIQYSTSSKFKNAKTVTVSKNKTTSKKVTKLKAKKKYYVRVRTYKTVKVNGKNTKIYSGWSKVKTIKTK